MAITTSTVFDIVALFPNRNTTGVAIFNGDTYVTNINSGFTGSYDTTTDEFQIILAAIQNGTAYESYRFGDGSTYTDADLSLMALLGERPKTPSMWPLNCKSPLTLSH